MDTFEQFALAFICLAIVALPLIVGGSTLLFSNRLDAERKSRQKK